MTFKSTKQGIDKMERIIDMLVKAGRLLGCQYNPTTDTFKLFIKPSKST